MNSSRLVSIVIPAYKPDFFEAALASALRQNHDEVEIVICDDCRDSSIKNIVDRMAENSRWPIRYFRNEKSLGEVLNVARGVAEARGNYVKFLYDDDILVPDCVRLLFGVLHNNPDIRLASSYRRMINEQGEFLPDFSMTRYPFETNVILNGPEVVAFMSQWPLNFIGEPSSVMCRREDVLAFGNDIMSLNGLPIFWLADVALYLKLLRKGNLGMLARPLSYFRISTQQTSHLARVDPGVSQTGHDGHYRMTAEMKWRREKAENTRVRVAPLSDRNNAKDWDLRTCFTWQSRSELASERTQAWINARVPSPVQQVLINQHLELNNGGPSIGVIISDLDNEPAKLLATLHSLISHEKANLRLRIVVLSAKEALPFNLGPDRLQWLRCTAEDRAHVLNQVLNQPDFDWVVLADAGSVFTAGGLLQIATRLIDEPTCRGVFGDEIIRQPENLKGLALRPDFNLDYLLSLPVTMARHWVFNRQTALEVDGFNADFAQALEFDLILRLIENGGLNGLLHVCEPLVEYDADPVAENPQEIAVIQRHLNARGYNSNVVQEVQTRLYRIHYGHPDQPLVSIIIPTRDQFDFLQRCVESILEKTSYSKYEIIIVDNNSESPEAVNWLAGVEAMQDDKIRILRYPHEFNYSAINNMAAQHARGEYLVLLNNDTAVLHPEWLENMLNHAQRPEVGIVGAKLLYPDGTIQHAGVVMGLNGPASHVFIGEAGDAQGYMQRLQADQNYSAVTAACLMVRKSLYEEVGGLDETDFKVSYNDVDLCLKIRDMGHLIVWTPYTVLLHEGNVSQVKLDAAHQVKKLERFMTEVGAFQAKWLPATLRDPAFNENLSADALNAQLEINTELTWRPLTWRPLPVVLAQPKSGPGLGIDRIELPLKEMRDAMVVDGILCHDQLAIAQVRRLNPDTIISQRAITSREIISLQGNKTFTSAFKVYDFDQYPHPSILTLDNRQEIHGLLRQGMTHIDRVIVSNDSLADILADLHDDIRVIPDKLDSAIWTGLPTMRRTSSKPRVGWVGNANQAGDIAVIAEVVKQLANEVEWIFMGPCPAELRPYLHELLDPVEGELRARMLASLNLDLIVAPARQTLINESKSNLELLEFGACGFPVVCSDVQCYQGDLPVTRVNNTQAAWLDAIRAHINELDTAARLGDQLKDKVLTEWLFTEASSTQWSDALLVR